ncbi:MAG: GNAT family N-acetyltransferase [Planctomycetaceae bacterium]|nr:GNAT family N-acetyltransferase [Planctomycetaceae bacterium]
MSKGLQWHETTADKLPELLELLFRHLESEERKARVTQLLANYEHAAALSSSVRFPVNDCPANDVNMNSFFHWTRENEIVGGLLTMLRPDGTVLALLPVIAPQEPFQTLRLTFGKLLDYSVSVNARLIMILVDSQQSSDLSLMEEFGFQKVSELMNMSAEQSVFPEIMTPGRLRFRPYTDDCWNEMVALVERTYEKTLDFPRLSGLVPTSEILRGYRESHPFEPSLWFFIEFQRQTIGALLLTQLERAEHLELTYVGLLPEFRGRHFAHEIVRYAQSIARKRQCQFLLVSVDSGNTPALATYVRLRFHVYDRKEIFVRFLPHEK